MLAWRAVHAPARLPPQKDEGTAVYFVTVFYVGVYFFLGSVIFTPSLRGFFHCSLFGAYCCLCCVGGGGGPRSTGSTGRARSIEARKPSA